MPGDLHFTPTRVPLPVTHPPGTYPRPSPRPRVWQPGILQVANILDAGGKRMQELDPDAGSSVEHLISLAGTM